MSALTTLFNLTDVEYVTAKVETYNSEYVVIARPWGVAVTCTRGTFAGQTVTGDAVWHTTGAMNGGLKVIRDSKVVLDTTQIASIYVLEN